MVVNVKKTINLVQSLLVLVYINIDMMEITFGDLKLSSCELMMPKVKEKKNHNPVLRIDRDLCQMNIDS
jgi:hypothetical protein